MSSPDFIVIGPGKSGTTWLYNLLHAHSNVCMAPAKETMFFNEYYHKGYDWYLSFFKHCEDQKVIGEATNTYIFSSIAPQRMFQFNSNISLLTVLRNPIDRAFSHYLFLLRNGEYTGSFEEILEKRPDILERGLYSIYLNRYLVYFPLEQLQIMLFDDLKSDPFGFAKNLFSFLNIDYDEQAIHSANSNKLPASAARSTILARFVKQCAIRIRDMGRPDLVTKVKNSWFRHLLYRPYEKYPAMRPESRERLRNYFYDDVAKLSEITNRDLVKLWLDPNV